ncbi:unnamed protein product [Brassica oleracea var. botrytis]|uniref:Uncharacterized protein n=1 Tax=Brassica oleracea TaxID=3712 RepID=A0A3P6H2P4_BRAOL|nr:unnamed protein product [Brassica oleracea]
MEAVKKEEIKKGPWKAEEDEVLINHVNRYGPRDWSSIRSKGLLQRTGKSCRLRWVNKLRPNLKRCFFSGCKFSAEEERTVIELQAEFGNKWARIATHLPGRTDNDVKNFWSSRVKRLARILHNSSDASTSPKPPSRRNKGKIVKPIQYFYPPQVYYSFGLVEEEVTTASSSSSKILPYSSSDQVDEALRLPELGIKLEHQPFAFWTDDPLMSEPHIANQQATIPFYPESRELLARLDNPYYYDILGPAGCSEPLFALPQPFFELPPAERRCTHVSKDDDEEEADVFLDDFPADMFDQVDDPNQSP